MATQGKGKNKKSKGVNVPLDVWLADEKQAPQGFNVVKTRIDWAEAMDNDVVDDTHTLNYKRTDNNKIFLPTAPKATRGPDIDMNRVPSQPPFKAYLGNLPYDISEQDISKFFSKLKIKDVRLIRENGRLKGFGYAEFDDRQSLIDALAHSGDNFRNRPLRVGLPGESDNNTREQREEKTDRTAGDWRAAPRDELPPRDNPQSRNGTYDNSYGDRGMQRSRTNYEPSGFDRVDHGGYGNRNRGFDGNDRSNDRTFERSNDRGFDRSNNDRGFDRSNNRNYGRNRGFERNESSFNRFESRDDRFERSDSHGGGGYGRRMDDRRYPDADSKYNDSKGYSERRRENSGHERSDHDNYPSSSPPPQSSESEPPKERPKLLLQPRSKPIESNETVATNSAIFGGAKPVNTAAREQLIEARLMKEKEEFEKKARDSEQLGGDNERIRRISAGSNGTTRSRKGSESGPQRDDYNRSDDDKNNTVPRSLSGSMGQRQRKYSDRSNVSDRSGPDSAPRQILRRKDTHPNSSQGSRQYQSQRSRDGDRPSDRPRGGGNSRRGNGSFVSRQGENRDRDHHDDNYTVQHSHKSDDDEERKAAYTSANKFAHLHDDSEDIEIGGVSE